MATRLEKKVAALVAKGQQPVVVLPPSARDIPPKRPPGRPRVRRPDDRLSSHRGRRGRSWPMCIARGCRNYLKVDQVGVCSDDCRLWVFNHALHLLHKIGATKAELVDSYDDPVQPPSPTLLTA